MADAVDPNRLLADTRAFLSDLEQNNTRAWFRDNKTRYDSALKRPAERLLVSVAAWLEDEIGDRPRTKLFRPHRDVRFSDDKTPFHTHLHMMWSLCDGRAWMVGLSTHYATAGAGMMQFAPEQLDRWREAVAGPAGDDLGALVTERGWRVDSPALARVPAPYPPDHPNAVLLRHKGFTVWRDDLDEAMDRAPETAVQTAFSDLAPVMDWLKAVA